MIKNWTNTLIYFDFWSILDFYCQILPFIDLRCDSRILESALIARGVLVFQDIFAWFIFKTIFIGLNYLNFIWLVWLESKHQSRLFWWIMIRNNESFLANIECWILCASSFHHQWILRFTNASIRTERSFRICTGKRYHLNYEEEEKED